MINCPKVSIIVPIYKKEHSIKKCVESILAQDYSNIEIILVNDGSPDRCGKIIDELAKKYSRIKAIHQKNLGVSVARNEGAKYVEGEYICYVDADDYLQGNYISMLVKAMEPDVDIVVSSTKSKCNMKSYYITKYGAVKKMFIDDYFGVCIWGKLFRKRIIPSNVFPKGIKMGEDMFALFKIINECNKVKFIPFNGYLYTEDEDENSFLHSDISDYIKAIELIDSMKKYLKDDNEDIDKYLEIGKVRRYLGLLNIIERKNVLAQQYVEKCIVEIKHFTKRYNYCKELSLSINLRLFFVTYLPQIYLRIIKRMMKNDIYKNLWKIG